MAPYAFRSWEIPVTYTTDGELNFDQTAEDITWLHKDKKDGEYRKQFIKPLTPVLPMPNSLCAHNYSTAVVRRPQKVRFGDSCVGRRISAAACHNISEAGRRLAAEF